MMSLLIRDMTEEGEQYVGTCTNVHESDEIDTCTRRRFPWLQETKSACVASPTVER